jgi:hypothetical protein
MYRTGGIKVPLILLLMLVTSTAFNQSCVKCKRSDYRHLIDTDKEYQLTRNEVLIEESVAPVRFKTRSRCKVLSGKWIEPYTGKTYTSPIKLDIDHVVPLKEALDSGDWKWSLERKKQFANYLKHENHLIAVNSYTYRKKGANNLAEWLPSNKNFLKDYAPIWIKIKVNWGLSADRAELIVLKKILDGEAGTYPREAPEFICAGNSFSAPSSVTRPSANRVVKKSRRGSATIHQAGHTNGLIN